MESHNDRKLSDVEIIEDRNELDAEMVAEEKALVRKIDLFLMPTIWIMYLLSYMDRTNIGMRNSRTRTVRKLTSRQEMRKSQV